MGSSCRDLDTEPRAPQTTLRAVTFDMDGLLVDSEPLWFQAESAVMERLHGAWAHGDQDVLVGGSMATTVAYLLSKGTRPAEPAAVARWLLEAMVEPAADQSGAGPARRRSSWSRRCGRPGCRTRW